MALIEMSLSITVGPIIARTSTTRIRTVNPASIHSMSYTPLIFCFRWFHLRLDRHRYLCFRFSCLQPPYLIYEAPVQQINPRFFRKGMDDEPACFRVDIHCDGARCYGNTGGKEYPAPVTVESRVQYHEHRLY